MIAPVSAIGARAWVAARTFWATICVGAGITSCAPFSSGPSLSNSRISCVPVPISIVRIRIRRSLSNNVVAFESITQVTRSHLGGRFGGAQTLPNPLLRASCGGGAATTSAKKEILGRRSLPKPHHRVTRVNYTANSPAMSSAFDDSQHQLFVILRLRLGVILSAEPWHQ